MRCTAGILVHSSFRYQTDLNCYRVHLDWGACFLGVNTCNLLKTWSVRPDSNRRRPAWEHGTSLCLQHLRVSDALFRLTQVSPYQSFPGLTALIEVGSRYIVFYLIPCFVLHPMATNSNGPRASASHRPIGVKSEFPQRQYTPTRAANKRRKCKPRLAIGSSRTCRVCTDRFGPDNCRLCCIRSPLD